MVHRVFLGHVRSSQAEHKAKAAGSVLLSKSENHSHVSGNVSCPRQRNTVLFDRQNDSVYGSFLRMAFALGYYSKGVSDDLLDPPCLAMHHRAD